MITRRYRAAAAAAGLLAMATATTAQAEQTPCVTRAEFGDFVLFVLPDLIDGVVETCRPVLGAEAFIATDGAALAQRYHDAGADSWPNAHKAMLASPTMRKLAGQLPDAALKPLIGAQLKQMITAELKPATCRKIDAFLGQLAPLPPKNMAGLVTLIVVEFSSNKPNNDQLVMFCPKPLTVTLPTSGQ